MPDEDGKLTLNQRKVLDRWMINQNIVCPVCESGEWKLLPYVLTIPVVIKGEIILATGKSTPASLLIQISCTCGVAIHLNARTVGIV